MWYQDIFSVASRITFTCATYYIFCLTFGYNYDTTERYDALLCLAFIQYA